MSVPGGAYLLKKPAYMVTSLSHKDKTGDRRPETGFENKHVGPVFIQSELFGMKDFVYVDPTAGTLYL